MKYQFLQGDISKTGLDIATFFLRNTDLSTRIENFKNFKTSFLSHPVQTTDLPRLHSDTLKKYEEYGWFGFTKSNFQDAAFDDRYSHYGGLGVTYNPYHWQGVENAHVHVLGDKRYNLGTLFVGVKGQEVWNKLILSGYKNSFYEIIETHGLKAGCQFLVDKKILDVADIQESAYVAVSKNQRGTNTYSDTLAMNRLTPAAQTGYLGEILKSVPRTIVRSRLVELKSADKSEVHWHVDEDLFICSRINVPIFSNLQQNLIVPDAEYKFEVGHYYSWDTGQPHKVEVHGVGSRINLVLGISPWFDFDTSTEVWSSNEFYGEAHPQEMFINRQLAMF